MSSFVLCRIKVCLEICPVASADGAVNNNVKRCRRAVNLHRNSAHSYQFGLLSVLLFYFIICGDGIVEVSLQVFLLHHFLNNVFLYFNQFNSDF